MALIVLFTCNYLWSRVRVGLRVGGYVLICPSIEYEGSEWRLPGCEEEGWTKTNLFSVVNICHISLRLITSTWNVILLHQRYYGEFSLHWVVRSSTYASFIPLQLCWQPNTFCPLRVALVLRIESLSSYHSRRVAFSVRYAINTWRVVQGLARRLGRHLHCKPSRAEPNRTESDSLSSVQFYGSSVYTSSVILTA